MICRLTDYYNIHQKTCSNLGIKNFLFLVNLETFEKQSLDPDSSVCILHIILGSIIGVGSLISFHFHPVVSIH